MLFSHLLSTPLFFALTSCTSLISIPTSGDEHLPNTLEKLSQHAFGESLQAVLDQPYANLKFVFLMHKYSLETSSKNPTYKYHCAFLANVALEVFVSTLDQIGGSQSLFLEHPDLLAAKVYEEMARTSPEQARRALQRINPKVYNESIGKEYPSVIYAYVRDGREPFGLSHLDKSLSKALADPQISVQLSDQQKKVLQKLQGGSLTYCPLLCYMLQNYQICDPQTHDLCQIRTQGVLSFWRSLVFSLMHGFALAFPDLAQEMTSLSIVPFNPFSQELPQKTLVFSEGLEDAVMSRGYLEDAACWGHIHVVSLFLSDPRADLSYAGWALEGAAGNGHNDIVELLLDQEIDRSHIRRALENAAWNGHKDVVELLLQMCPEITLDDTILALGCAAGNGHKDTFEFLLKDPRVTANHAGGTLCSAASGGHRNIVTFLLETFPKIEADRVGWALHRAANNGRENIVELFLSDSRVTGGHIFTALYYAALNGHRLVVELLLGDNRMTAGLAVRVLGSLEGEDYDVESYNLIKTRISSLPGEKKSCVVC